MIPSIRAMAAAGFVLIGLSGCPAPILSGYEEGSRQNVPGLVPAFIKPTETTREDVMMRLGEPDAFALNESWISYGSAYRLGGVLLLVPYGGGGYATESIMRYSRLIIEFDSLGVVTKPILETKNCFKGSFIGGKADLISEPCLDILGNDIPERFGLSKMR